MNEEQHFPQEGPQQAEAPQHEMPQHEAAFTASSDPGFAGAAAPRQMMAETPPINEQPQPQSRRERRSVSPGLLIAVAVVTLALAVGLGWLAGRGAAEKQVEQALAGIEENMQQYFAEAGGAVLYRSVDTDIISKSDAAVDVGAVSDLAADSVVEIGTQVLTDYGWFGQALGEGAGSGVILSEDGYILTSNHVIEGAQNIHISLRNGEEYEATVVGQDAESDVAVLKIEATGLTAAVLGDSDQLSVGSPAVVIGNPLGRLGGSVTAGVISALDRQIKMGEETYNLLQTDAAINKGNSGGGLFNSKGELIGLVMAKSGGVSVEGLGFAIPINDIKDIIDDLINYGYVASRVVLGVTLVNISDERTAMSYGVDELGVYILKVSENSNASYAGLKTGDRLISVDGEIIENADQVVAIIQGHSAGDILTVEYSRSGEISVMDVTLYGVLPEQGEQATVTSAL